MNDARREELRLRLDEMAAALEEALRISLSGARPVSLDEPIGRLSRVSAMQQQAMTLAGRSGFETQLQQVKLALRRIEDGTYGTCVACGDDMPDARLDARPEAPSCVECLERADALRGRRH